MSEKYHLFQNAVPPERPLNESNKALDVVMHQMCSVALYFVEGRRLPIVYVLNNRKVPFIKAVRELTGWSLYEAKAYVENFIGSYPPGLTSLGDVLHPDMKD